MKFDCIIGNPPFNDASSTVKGTTRHSMTKQLHLEFLNRSINGVEKGGDVAIICPATKWWIGKDSDKNVAEYTKKGMKRVFNASKDGPAFDGATIENIGVFHLQSGSTKLDLNEFDTGIKKPKIALTDLFKFHSHPGLQRPKFESKLIEAGEYKVWATIKENGFTNSNDFFKDASRGKWRVIFNHVGSKNKIGRIEIAHPTDYLSYSISCFEVKNRAQAELVVKYLTSDKAQEFISSIKISDHNTRHLFTFVDGSQFAEGV